MNINELSKKLNEMFYSGENKNAMILLFMISYHTISYGFYLIQIFDYIQ